MSESLTSESLDFEVQTDILTLLENVKCQGNNPSGLKQALLTLATIFNSSVSSQEYFYTAGGVEELKALLLEGSCPLMAVPAALYCLACAVRQNVTSQNAVLTQGMLSVLHELLSHSDSSDTLQQTAAFLLACAVDGSCRGQMLAEETGCLQDLIDLFRECMTTGYGDENMWSVITKAIGFCVNNPQNVHNQQICCRMLPHTLKFISTEPRHQYVSHVFSLISLVVANNVSNQDRIRRCGGIQTLVEFIKKQVCLQDISVPLSLVTNAMSAIDVCIADNEESGMLAGELGLVSVLLDLLQERDLELNQVHIFILTLAHVLQSSRQHCHLVSEGRGYHILVNFLTEYQDDELLKVIKYILTLCKTGDNIQQNDVHDEVNTDNLRHSTRDLTFLKESLGALSSLLNSIENVSENTQWIRSVNTANQLMDDSDIHSDTPVDNHYSDNMLSSCNMLGELPRRTGNSNVFERNGLPHGNNHSISKRSILAPRSDSNADLVQNRVFSDPSYVRDRWLTGGQGQEGVLNSYKDKNSDAGNKQFVQSRGTATEMNKEPQEKFSGASRRNCHNQHGVQNLRVDAQTVFNISSYDLPTQKGTEESTSWNNAHRSETHYISTGDSEDISSHQCVYKSNKPSACSDIYSNLRPVYDNNTELWYARNVNNHHDTWSNRTVRPDGESSKEMSIIENQDNYQEHLLTGNDSGNIETSRFSQERINRTLCVEEGQVPNQRKSILYPRAQDHHESNCMLPGNSFHYIKQKQQILGTVNDMQCPQFSDCRGSSMPQMRTASISSEDHGLEYHVKTPGYICSGRLYDEPAHSTPSISPARHTETINNSYSLLNKSDFHHVPRTSTPCSTARHSVPRTVNSCIIDGKETRAAVSSHENQHDLLAQLQRVMSSFFQSLIPGQVDTLPRQTDTGSKEHPTLLTDHASSTQLIQTLDEQNLPLSDTPSHPVSSSENILSVCEVLDLSDTDGHKGESEEEFSCQALDKMKMLETKHAAENKVNQSLNDMMSEHLRENSSLSVHPEHCRHSLLQKDDTTSISATSKVKHNAERSPHTNVTSGDIFEDQNTFAKPSQLPPPAIINHRVTSCGSNIRLAGTPITAHKSIKTPVKSVVCQPTPSPAMSQFDSHLMRIAQLSTRGYSVPQAAAFRPETDEPDESTSGFESMCASEGNGNLASVWAPSEKKKDPVASHHLPSADESSSQSPRNVISSQIPLYRRNVTPLSTSMPLPNLKKYLQPQNDSEASKSPYRYDGLIRKRNQCMMKADLISSCPNYSPTSSCPGCVTGLQLNSCTYNIAIETCAHTCAYHRNIRQCEREYIRKQLISKQTPTGRTTVTSNTKEGVKPGTTTQDVYEFQSDSTELMSSASVKTSGYRAAYIKQVSAHKQDVGREGRRSRVLYTKQELLNLLDGVTKMGKRWHQILCTYEFHPSRTAVDLKDKYKKLQAQEEKMKQAKSQTPFSMCEIRRLKSGVKHLGYNWKAILKGYKFLPGRTAADLHKQWRSLNQAHKHAVRKKFFSQSKNSMNGTQ